MTPDPLTQNMDNFMLRGSITLFDSFRHNNFVPFSTRPNPYVNLKCMSQSRPKFVLQVIASLFLQCQAIDKEINMEYI